MPAAAKRPKSDAHGVGRVASRLPAPDQRLLGVVPDQRRRFRQGQRQVPLELGVAGQVGDGAQVGAGIQQVKAASPSQPTGAGCGLNSMAVPSESRVLSQKYVSSQRAAQMQQTERRIQRPRV